jgi:hypothetical protein
VAGRYHHTQRGTFMLVAMSIGAIAGASASYLGLLSPTPWLPWALAITCVLGGWLFSSLTVEVDEREIRWFFGPGLWKYRIARADIDNARILHSTWWIGLLNGYGIRMRPGYRLYTVSGLDAVELRLKSGDIRRIGTDDPQGLAAALNS